MVKWMVAAQREKNNPHRQAPQRDLDYKEL
jgi:hypothetical protein